MALEGTGFNFLQQSHWLFQCTGNLQPNCKGGTLYHVYCKVKTGRPITKGFKSSIYYKLPVAYLLILVRVTCFVLVAS